MSQPGASADEVARGVAFTRVPEGLSAIHHPDCAAAIWRRSPLPCFQSWIDALEPERLPKARVILRPGIVRETALHICEACGTPGCAERDLLIDDAAALASLFAELVGAAYLQFRFDVVSADACPQCDADTGFARLVCAYRGTGTHYGFAAEGAEPERVFTVPTGAPILLRGPRWPGSPGSGLQHCSPPIEDTGQTRLILVLDPAIDPDHGPGRKRLH
ncbi:MAG: DUF1826 domain-containing protein [Pseudomonadota bacterium]